MKKTEELKLDANDLILRSAQEPPPEKTQNISNLEVEVTAIAIPDLDVQDVSRRKELINALKESYKGEERPRSKARKQIDIVL